MKWFKNLRTTMKLMMAFATVCLLMAAIALYALQGMGNVQDNFIDVYENRVIPLKQLNEVIEGVQRIRANVLLHVVASDEAQQREAEKQIKQLDENIEKQMKAYTETKLVAEEEKGVAAFRKEWSEYQRIRTDQVLKNSSAGNKKEAATLATGQALAVFREAQKAANELFQINFKIAEETAKRGNAEYKQARLVTLSAILLGSGFALFLGYLIARVITVPLKLTVATLKDIAQGEGDLTVRLNVNSQDEVGEVCLWFNTFIEKLEGIISSIAKNTHSLAGSAEELTSVSHQMSSNSEETAAQSNVVSAASEQVSKNIQTVAAGAEEMSASIKEIAKNTSEAARVAKEAVEVVGKTNQTITKLGASSAEIGNVIKVITSIAEQTNLLALNATIEAARAGEAGKGFAVVANEVKELAKQTGDATEDISAKIGAIQHDTQGAVAAIQQISGIINQVSDIANTIASAVEEQSVTTNEISRNVSEAAKGSNEIVQNITGVAEAAQSTASGATQTQSAAQELARLASDLQSLVNQFKYDDEAQRMRPAIATKEQTRTAPRMAQHQPKPTYRPADTTLHEL